MNKVDEGNINNQPDDWYDIQSHGQPGAIYYKGEPMDMVRLEGKEQHYKNALGTRKVILNIDTGDYIVQEKEVEDV